MTDMDVRILCLLVLSVCLSCQDNKKDQAQRMVKEWSNRELLFPEHPVFTRFVRYGTNETGSFQIEKNVKRNDSV